MINRLQLVGGGEFQAPLFVPDQEQCDALTKKRVTDAIISIQNHEPGVLQAKWQGRHLVVKVRSGFNPCVVERRIRRRLSKLNLLRGSEVNNFVRAS